jgi:hypothetical protein
MAGEKKWSTEDISTFMESMYQNGFASDLEKFLDLSYERAKASGEYKEEDLEKILAKEVSQKRSIEIINGIANTIENTANILLQYRNKEIELMRAGIELLNNTLQSQLSLSAQSIGNSLNTISQIYAGNVKNIGKTALGNQMSLIKDSLKYEHSFSQAVLKWQNSFENTQWEYYTNLGNNVIELFKDGKNDYNRLFGADKLYSGIDDATYSGRDANLKAVENNTEALANFGKQLVDVGKKINTNVLEPVRQFTLEQQKAINDYTEQILESLENTFKPLTEIIEQVKLSLFELDKGAKQTALSFGYIGNKGQQFTQKILNENAKVAALWGKEFKDLLSNQEKYLENADRNYLFSAKDQDVTFAAARLYGMENASEMSALFGDMNIFNTSIEKGADTMREMYDIANQMGVSNKKFVKDLSSNLKLAQKYNFVGGTKAMEKMSLWAQQVRLNLNSAAQFAEKLIGGGIEETLTTAANLQVLGGNAAIFSDPLGMMYDAGADMESMAHRIEAMVGNFGTLDRKTGETTFSWTDTKMMNEIAKALGMSREEVMNINREKNKRSVVSRQMSNTGLTEEQKRMVSNRAVYDETTGKFMVNTLTHGKQTVDQLTPELLKDILPEDNQEALVEYAKRSLDVETELLAIARETTGLAMVGSATAWYEAQQKMLEETINSQQMMVNLSNQNSGKLWNMELQSYKGDIARAKQASDEGLFDKYVGFFNNNVNNTNKIVSQLNSDLTNLSDALSGNYIAMGSLYQKIGYMIQDDTLIQLGEQLSNMKEFQDKYGSKNLISRTGFDILVNGSGQYPDYGNNLQYEQNLNTSRGSEYLGHQFKLKNTITAGDAISYRNVNMGDGEIRNPVMASIDNADRLYAAKSGGALDKSLEIIAAMVSHISNQIKNGIDTNTNLNVNGNLNVQGNNIDVTKLVKMISNDTDASYELLKLVNDTMSKQENLKVRTTRLI